MTDNELNAALRARDLISAELEDRKARRVAAAQEAGRLPGRIEQMRGAQILDHVDLSAKIAEAEENLERARQILSEWPVINAELSRRLNEANERVNSLKAKEVNAAMLDVLRNEQYLRAEFRDVALKLIDVSSRLRVALAAKQRVVERATLDGVIVKVSDMLPPAFNHLWLRNESAAAEGRRTLMSQ